MIKHLKYIIAILIVLTFTGQGYAGDFIPKKAIQVKNTPAGNISSTNVQAAINELDSEKQVAGSYLTSVGVANMASVDFGSWTCNGSTCTVDNGAIGIAQLASVDFGGFTCNGSTCTIDSDSAHSGFAPSASPTLTGTVNIGTSSVVANQEIHNAGTLKFWDSVDDTSVTLGPVANGTTTLGVTGTINATGLKFSGTPVAGYVAQSNCASPLIAYGVVCRDTDDNKWYKLDLAGTGIEEIGGGGSQTPWTSNIAAAGYNLTGLNLLSSTTSLIAATGNEAAWTLNYTTNKATSGNDTGLLINQTDTLSPGTSNLIDAQVGGVSKFSVTNNGIITIGGGIAMGQSATVNTNSINVVQPANPLLLLSSKNWGGTSGTGINMVSSYNVMNSSGIFNAVAISPNYWQSGTAGGTDLLINRTETAVGSGSQYLTQYQVGGANLQMLTNKGHVIVDDAVTGSYPALTSCGNSPTLTAGSNDYAGTFVMGATGTGCVITFGTAYTNVPACTLVAETSANLTSYTKTASAITVVGLPGTFNYVCVGLNGGI